MSVYNAIMKAANHVERNPADFHFMVGTIPKAPECGTPGCALGWIGYFSGNVVRNDQADFVKVAARLGIVNPRLADRPDLEFYRMLESCLSPSEREQWQRSAALCAKGLRLYAEKYHGHEKQPTKIRLPDWKTIAASPLIPEHVRSEEVT